MRDDKPVRPIFRSWAATFPEFKLRRSMQKLRLSVAAKLFVGSSLDSVLTVELSKYEIPGSSKLTNEHSQERALYFSHGEDILEHYQVIIARACIKETETKIRRLKAAPNRACLCVVSPIPEDIIGR